jgi:flagellar biosynthesis chaperone FliJ
MQTATVTNITRQISAEEFRADHARLQKIAKAWDRAMAARKAVQLVKQRNKRTIESAEAEYKAATDELSMLMTGVVLS